jgi:hypothetical protein
MNLLKHLANMGAELLTHRELPYPDERISRVTGTRLDRNHQTVIEIEAPDYQEALRVAGRDGITIEGNVSKALVRVGHNRWEARVEECYTSSKQMKDMTLEEYQEWLDARRY